MRALIEAANATGNFVLGLLSPVPEDVVVIGAGVLVASVWIHNFRTWVRARARGRARLAPSVALTSTDEPSRSKEN